jgi:DNA polymerase
VNLLCADYETFYTREYSLKRMTPVEYILDPRYETIGCSFQWGVDGEPWWIEGPELPAFFATLDPAVTLMVTHNALFDMCITAWRYGFVPALMADSMGIARAVRGHLLRSVSLDAVSKHLGLPPKGDTVHKVEGMNLAAIKAVPGLYAEYVAYCKRDCANVGGIWAKLVHTGEFPVGEIAVMDMVLRMAVEPSFVLDPQLLVEHLADVKAAKAALLARIGIQADENGKAPELMSNERFAGMLRALGVDPPMKISKTTGEPTYAFAKSDGDFLELADDENPDVQALVEARLGHKSTLEESRSQRFINISRLTWPGNRQRLMPIPLRFSGAHTHRLSGDWQLNGQNLGRKSKLRRALRAPDDCDVVIIDAAQIEAREVAYFCGQESLVAQFAAGEDVYASFASSVFGFVVTKLTHPTERFVGKQGILGLGYNLAWPTFQSRLKSDSKNQTGTMIELSDVDAMRVVNTYRTKYAFIPATWQLLNSSGINVLANGGQFQFGPCLFEKGSIRLPSGLRLWYPDMAQEPDEKTGRVEWRFSYAGKRKKIYGGKLLENMMQALARIHTFDAALRIQRRSRVELGVTIRLKQQAHDENGFVVPKPLVPDFKVIAMTEMCTRPFWAPNLPLAAEIGVGSSYGDAK